MTSTTGSHGGKKVQGSACHRLCVVRWKVRYRSLAKKTTPRHKTPVVVGKDGFFKGSQLRLSRNLSAQVRMMLAMNPAVMPHVFMCEQSPTLTKMQNSWIRLLLKPKEILQKERKTTRLQECSSLNVTTRSWTNVQ
jgi:hypothetical protein